MNIVIIGSGNVATVMGGKIKEAGHTVGQIVGRSEAPAALLAGELKCTFTTDWRRINTAADLYIVTLSDSSLVGLGGRLGLADRLVVHTAGAVPRSVLSDVSRRNGVLYPLQSLRKEVRPFPEMPLLIDAALPEDLTIIEALARSISRHIAFADDDTRLKLHLSATVVNNFPNFLYTLTADYCRSEKIPFSLLLPLIEETNRRLADYPPAETQTGPAVRGDGLTIERHLHLLSNYQDIKELYSLFTKKIEQYYPSSRIPLS
ncbi:MAG TPA: DUF2520 domain-containing protein [Puia sp.]|jgi:predicted short-subunit dehydrogenase-like oxidoreductase (DUF2520 family)|nr:DUF2520 domain-containing protein [Puia sp.]